MPPTTKTLSSRDEAIVSLLRLVPGLTHTQLHALLCPDLSLKHFQHQLFRLEHKGVDHPGPLRQHRFGQGTTRPSLWTLTDKLDFANTSIAHHSQVAQLFVDLALRFQAPPVQPGALPFSWIPESHAALDFTWDDRRTGLVAHTAVKPDAILEAPATKRRFFLEYETGTNATTTSDPAKDHAHASSAVTAKLGRYAWFFTHFHPDFPGTSWYADRWPDRFTPELIFVFANPKQAEKAHLKITQHLKRDYPDAPFHARALTDDEASHHLAALLQARSPASGRVLTIPETDAFDIRDNCNALTSLLNDLSRAIDRHNRSCAHPIALPPHLVNATNRLSQLIEQRLLSTPAPHIPWASKLVTAEKKRP